MSYELFISYRHSENSRSHAESLERALKRYAKPLWKPPMRIFRDERVIRPGDDLPREIRRGLEASRFLIYLASPEAARSSWVEDELRIWCDLLHRKDRLIIAHIDGHIEIDQQSKAILWDRTDALPRCMRTQILSIPYYSNFQWAKTDKQRDINNVEYKREINGLVARLRDVTPGDMNDKDVLSHRHNVWAACTAATIVFLSLTAAARFAYDATVAQTAKGAATTRALRAENKSKDSQIQADAARTRELLAQNMSKTLALTAAQAEAEALRQSKARILEEAARRQAQTREQEESSLRSANRAIVLSYSEYDPAKAIAYALQSAKFARTVAAPIRIGGLLSSLPAHQTIRFAPWGSPPVTPCRKFNGVRRLAIIKGGRVVVVHHRNNRASSRCGK